MLSNAGVAKSDLITRAIEEAERSVDDLPDLDAYLKAYYRHVSDEGLAGRDPVDVFGAAISEQRLAAVRPVGTANVRVFNPTPESHGWTSLHTMIEIVTDDMPFLVDSVTSALGEEGLALHLVVHPQFTVERSLNGELQRIRLTPEERQVPGGIPESWMQFEVDRMADPSRLRDIERRLVDVLRDVRDAVEDWAKMREAAQRIADELHESPPNLPPEEIADTWELLRWLIDEHFTFLGYREYSLQSHDGEDVLVTKPGSGLGLLRGDHAESASFSKLPPEVRAKARERQLLILTKANSRSTV